MLDIFKSLINKLTTKKDEVSYSDWGYSTPNQKRYKIGDKLKISEHKVDKNDKIFYVGCDVWVVELGRHDYLVRNNHGEYLIVYQYELINNYL